MRSRTDLRAAWPLLLAAGCTCAPSPPPPPPPAPPKAAVSPVASDAGPKAPAPERLSALVLSLGGAVEVLRAGSKEWLALAVGDAVQVGDQVRTAPGGHLELSFGVAQVAVREDSELELTVLTPREVWVSVTGAGEATLPDGKGELSFSAGDAVASTTGGRLALTFDGATATATALKGSASLTAGGRTVALREGEFATAGQGRLGKAAKLPKKVSLDVTWPPETETNRAELALRGKASAHARVLVMGRRVETGADGTFQANVALKRGRQTVVVTAVDPLGRKASRSKQFVMDTEAPSIKGAVEYE